MDFTSGIPPTKYYIDNPDDMGPTKIQTTNRDIMGRPIDYSEVAGQFLPERLPPSPMTPSQLALPAYQPAASSVMPNSAMVCLPVTNHLYDRRDVAPPNY
jgi:hypothetical protein